MDWLAFYYIISVVRALAHGITVGDNWGQDVSTRWLLFVSLVSLFIGECSSLCFDWLVSACILVSRTNLLTWLILFSMLFALIQLVFPQWPAMTPISVSFLGVLAGFHFSISVSQFALQALSHVWIGLHFASSWNFDVNISAFPLQASWARV